MWDPPFKIPLERVVIDEPHLLLRVMDQQEEDIIKESMNWDKVSCPKHTILNDYLMYEI